MTADQESRTLAIEETLEQLTARLSDAAKTLSECKTAARQASSAETYARNEEAKAKARIEVLKAALNYKLESL